MTLYHHQSAHKVAKEVLNNWRNGKWENEFVSNVIFRTHPSSIFPSPDADFLDQDKNTKISIEFKPHTESKRGMMTGLGQSIAYLNKSDASYLVSPSRLSEDLDFDLEIYLKEIFLKFIKGKLPIGLIIYDGENIDNIRLSVEIDSILYSKSDLKLLSGQKGSDQPYWAFWRDYSVDAFYKLALSSSNIKSKKNRSDKVYDEFYFNYFATPDVIETLNPISTDILKPDMKTKMIPFETKKKELKSEVLSGLKSQTEAKEYFYKKCLSKNETDNLYRDYKKNLFSTMKHLNLWDENFCLTNLGIRFVERCQLKANDAVTLKQEFAQILLVEGKHDTLIEDIINYTENADLTNIDDSKYKENLRDFFETSGFIKRNPNRSTSGSRKFLTEQLQLWNHLDLKEKVGNRHFIQNKGYVFNIKLIESLVSKFYENYGDVTEMIKSETQISALN